MVVESMHLLQYFYPSHYTENIPIEMTAIQDVLNYWFEVIVAIPYEQYLNQLILVSCRDSIYMNNILHTMNIDYIDEQQVSFLMKTKRVLSIPKLFTMIQEYFFPEQEMTTEYPEGEVSIHVDFEQREDLIQQNPYLQFLEKYLYNILPVNFDLQIDGFAFNEDRENTNTIASYGTYQIADLEDRSIQDLRYRFNL